MPGEPRGGSRPFADEAGRKGWPVRRENADHLAMLTRPDQLADILDQLRGLLAGRRDAIR